MNDITFEKGRGGVPRSLPGEDHISGIMMYIANADLPSGFSTTNRVKSYSIIDSAEADGIVDDSANWKIKALHYHISEFFRANPGGVLHVGLYDVPGGAYNYNELKLLQQAADGKIRQAAVYVPEKDFAAGELTALQAVATSLFAQHMPLVVLLGANVTTATELPVVATTGQSNVSVVIGQDGSGVAKTLFETPTHGRSVTVIGFALGCISLAAVNESIQWVAKFPTGIDNPALCDGSLIKNLDNSVLATLDTRRYIFLRKHVGIASSYFNDSHNMDVATSDYAYIENVRTIDKAIRGIRTYVLPELGAPLYVNPDSGKLRASTVTHLENIAGKALEDMEKKGELSGYRVDVDPNQNVLSSSEVEFVIQKVGVGVMRKVKVKIGYTTKLD